MVVVTIITPTPATARLVVEVSVSSLLVDREMATVYAEADVAEYWIVNRLVLG